MKIIKAIALSVVLFFAVSSAGSAAELKIGVVNLQKALNECQAGKEAKQELEAETKKMQEQVDAKQEELKKLNKEMEKKKSVWSDEMKEQKQRELQTGIQEFQMFYMQSNENFKKKMQEKEAVIIRDLIDVAKRLAKEKGYIFVFETQGDVIYNPQEADITDEAIKRYKDAQKVDITEEVIKLYNDEYKKGIKFL